MATKIKICTTSIKKQIASAVGSKYRWPAYNLPPEIAFNVILEVDPKLGKKIETDDKLANAIFAGVGKHQKLAVKETADIFLAAEKEALALRRKIPPLLALKAYKKKSTVIVKDAVNCMEKRSQLMIDHANAEINKWLKVRGDRTQYKRKAFIKVTLSTVGVVAASLGTAGSISSGGAGLGIAIYGLAKAIVGLGKEIRNLAIGIDKAEKKLRKDLMAVKKAYLNASSQTVSAKEIGMSVVERILTYEMKSISKCEKELDLFVGKLRGIDVKAGNYGKKLHKLLDKQGQLDKLIVAYKKQLLTGGRYMPRKLPKLEKSMQKLATATSKAITSMESLYKRIDKGQTNEKHYRKALTQLQAQKPDWVKYFEMATALIDITLGATVLEKEALSIIPYCIGIGVEIGDIAEEEM